MMFLNCAVGEDSWESLGLQGDPTSEIMEGKKGRKEKRNEGRKREDKESKGI